MPMSNPQKQKCGDEMKKLIAIGLMVITASSLIFAQTVTPGIDKAQKHQRSRIHQGVKSGELTRREAHQLNKQQIHIQKEKRIAKIDGVVTSRERKHIKHEQKRANKNIAVKKYNRFERRNKS